VPHQSIKKSLNNNETHSFAIFNVINWSLTADYWPVKGKLKHPQSLHQLKGRCITITIPHNTACLEKR